MSLRGATSAILVLLTFSSLRGQKQGVDIAATRNWASVGLERISADGRYISYKTYHVDVAQPVLVLQSLAGKWMMKFPGADEASFSSSGRFAIIKGVRDSLFAIDLQKPFTHPVFIDRVADYKTGYHDDIAFHDAEGKFVYLQLDNHLFQPFPNSQIVAYTFSSFYNTMLWVERQETGAGELHEFNILKRTLRTVYTLRAEEGFDIIATEPQEADSGNHVLINLVSKETRKPLHVAVALDVWSYTDTSLQSVQLSNLHPSGKTIAVNIRSGEAVGICSGGEQISQFAGRFAITVIEHERSNEAYWNRAASPVYHLVSLEKGIRTLLSNENTSACEQPFLSPTGRWVIWYSLEAKHFFSLETQTGKIRNITQTCKTEWERKNSDVAESQLCYQPAKHLWLRKDDGLIMWDNNDIWLVDPTNQHPARNLTNGYGARHGLRFMVDPGLNELGIGTYSRLKRLIIKAFDKKSRDMGFYQAYSASAHDPQTLSMGGFSYLGAGQHPDDPFDIWAQVQKAEKASAWLVTRASATESPNIYFTLDFKNFKQITSVRPHNNYNWLTTEIYKTNLTEGILYKPEDFDSSKRYPVIFYYYEKRSSSLNEYLSPSPSTGSINIPLAVSNGYIVYSPDLHFEPGNPGQSAFDIITDAARKLRSEPWVDSTHLGLQGHSWGGYITNYVITHTNMFAAACSASGVVDMVSDYGSGKRGGFAIYSKEQSQGRMLEGPWARTQSYISNSPVYYLDKVSTPLLIMHNKNDRPVHFQQGMEMFTGLRRLGKRVWMLQYDEGGHDLDYGKDAEDYQQRMMQFFDHYLKAAPAPRWLLQGIPAREKGVETGLELVERKDSLGRWLTPGAGLVR